jgi:hypothetical protein
VLFGVRYGLAAVNHMAAVGGLKRLWQATSTCEVCCVIPCELCGQAFMMRVAVVAVAAAVV